MLIIIIILLSSVLLGLAVAGVGLLLPPGRALPDDPAARKSAAFWFAVVSFCSGLLLCTGFNYVGASVIFVFGEQDITHRGHIWQEGRIVGDAYDEELRQTLHHNRAAITRELWLRLTVPPPWQQPCFSSQATICDLADRLAPSPESSPVRKWLIVVPGLLAALVSGLSIWFSSLPRRLLRSLGVLKENRGER